MAKAKSVIDVILGEAKAGSYEDMLAIASVIENRARQLGVSPEEVVSVRSEFNAYGKSLPAGVDKHRELARQALEQVRTTGPVHDATFYATPSAAKSLPSGLEKVTASDGHVFFSDPSGRAIRTSAGFRQPQSPVMSFAATGPMPPSSAPRTGQQAIEASMTAPNLRSRAANVTETNSAPLGLMPSLDSAFDYPLGQRDVRVAKGFAYGPENFDINKMDPDTAYAARRAFDNLGINPTINSAFRSGVVPEKAKYDYNSAVDGKPHSQHKHGKALDISTRGMTNAQKAAMVDSLMAEGLGGIGVGSNIIHADSGRPRTWDYNNPIPSEVQDVINARREGGRLNRYPSDFGNIPAPQAKPTEPTAIDMQDLGPVAVAQPVGRADVPTLSSVDYSNLPALQSTPSFARSLSPVTPREIGPVANRSAPIQSYESPARSLTEFSVPDFTAVRPTASEDLSLFSPIGPEISPRMSTGPSRRLGPRGPSLAASAPMTRFETAFAPFDTPTINKAATSAVPEVLTPQFSNIDAMVPRSKPVAPIEPPNPVPMRRAALPSIDAPVVNNVGMPRVKPEAPPPNSPAGKFLGRMAGAALGGFLAGPLGAGVGGLLGGQLGKRGMPQMGPFSLGPIVSREGFGRTPVGGAVNAATRGGGFDNRTFTKTYADLGGSSDPRSYSRALAEEQRQRAAAGQKTIADAFGGLFR